MKQKYFILLVEDDHTLGYVLSEYLTMNNYEVVWEKDGHSGLKTINRLNFDLCILDIMMPQMNGYELAKAINHEQNGIPFIFLTAKVLKVDKLKGFNLGAEDYICKPVDEEELLARIRAVIRRTTKSKVKVESDKYLSAGSFVFDTIHRTIELKGKSYQITEKEAKLLSILIENKNNISYRNETLKIIWGSNDYFTRKSMDVHIYKLRKILQHDDKIKIINIRDKGFILSEESN